MIEIKNKVDCCGCNACGDACAHGAITFKTDIEGFWYPEVDKAKCVDCGLCEKVCPIINVKELKKNDFEQSECYAAQAKNLESLFNSTSGSAFATLAEKMYKQGGYVGGAIFNDDFSITQFISSNKADLEKLRNSKYAQSDSNGFYKQVKQLLNNGEKVLVCGLPCQMAALRAFLRKDYEQLIIIDLICLGINSPKILQGYLKYMEEKHNSKIVYYKAKNKELGWRKLTTKIVFENGDVEYDTKENNYFTHGFIGTHAFSRPSCYECKFKGTPRIADITIGDFWGVENILGSEYDHDLGTSVIMLNSQKGKNYYQQVKSHFREAEIPYSVVVKGNPALITPISKPSIDRQQFYQDLEDLPFIDFAKKYINLPSNKEVTKKRRIKNVLSFLRKLFKTAGFNIPTLFKNVYYNFFCKQINAKVSLGNYIIINKYCVLDIDNSATIDISGVLQFGHKKVKGSRLESRLILEKDAFLKLSGGTILYGADIEVFKNAKLVLGKGIVFNMGSTIICGDKITIGDGVCFGRNVTVRDNSGEHFMSRRTFKNKRPVTIGAHSWLTEQVTVMPGAKIGVGVIISARSLASGKFPNFTLVSGSPAEIVDEDISWKA